MSENYHARLGDPKQHSPLFNFFSRIILQAWEACRSGSKKDHPFEPPTIVIDITSNVNLRRSPKNGTVIQNNAKEQRAGRPKAIQCPCR